MSKICIDPGHGGKDSGAVGNGMKEKDINLTVAKEVQRLLKEAGHTVIMSRTDDTYLSLTQRANISNQNKADYFVSIHHNAGGGRGYEVIHSIYEGKGKELALKIAEEFKALGQEPHGNKGVYSRKGSNGKDYYGVIRQTACHAVITEFGFIDTDDAQIFNTHEKLLREAEAIVNGIIRQLGGFLKVSQPVQKEVPKPVAKLKGDYGVVTASVLNVRAGHSTQHAVLGTLKKGEKVRIGTKVGEWYNIYWGAHGGWVHSEYIKLV